MTNSVVLAQLGDHLSTDQNYTSAQGLGSPIRAKTQWQVHTRQHIVQLDWPSALIAHPSFQLHHPASARQHGHSAGPPRREGTHAQA